MYRCRGPAQGTQGLPRNVDEGRSCLENKKHETPHVAPISVEEGDEAIIPAHPSK